MQLITSPGRNLPLHDLPATRRLEQRALAAVPPGTLVARAGLALARLTLALAPHDRCCWVLAGPGHNGADALEAAWHLARSGRAVTASVFAADLQALVPAAAQSLQRAREAGATILLNSPTPPADCALALDGLLGIGSARAIEGAMARAVQSFNAITGTRLAVDVPSGLDAGTGRTVGSAVAQATDTLTMLNLKTGLFTGAGRAHCGRLWLASLDVVDDEPPQAWLAGRALRDTARAPRAHAQHKGSYGDALVIGGAQGMHGAALLAARAALSAGAGRVYMSLLEGTLALDPTRPELMLRDALWRAGVERLSSATVLCGCGGGQAVAAALPLLLEQAVRLVLDADGLNAVAADPALAQALRARAGRNQATVLTPHPLEAARLLGCSAAQVQANRLAAAQRLADDLGAVVVLKGSGSVVAAPGALPYVNPTGNAALASPGTGDVLAGWLTGQWSTQAGTGALQALVAAGVQLHGAAADAHVLHGPLLALDLIDAMRRLA
ncbi:NAD(P)H-hydrate dehydratase [Azohydromonas caseinilytica]|uniref:ADP-dependent (S)-NAD(P)H-hydrate dehydratase n=1 Tax=Azohydromonas caseinilytica TaxID=2728836 RepID=A0A848F7R1_9BURK|nr:NAD(P)H-hydrate dehydratase [Azohydromonas caseinilytica]NML14290.1 NAD(P)H-hydrate dehydratase [Azohydromonas caseinilytica]